MYRVVEPEYSHWKTRSIINDCLRALKLPVPGEIEQIDQYLDIIVDKAINDGNMEVLENLSYYGLLQGGN